MSPLNILEVTEACGAGVGRHLISLCRGLADQGHRVSVAYSPHRMDRAFEKFVGESRDVRFFPMEVGREVSPVSDVKGLLRLLNLIKSEGPFDIVHGHSSKGGALSRVAGRLYGVPTVYTPHSLILSSPELSMSKAMVYGLIERLLGRLATSGMIAVSEEETEFIRELNLTPGKRTRLIENGLDPALFQLHAGQRPAEDLNRKPLTFGCIMRFSSQKAPGNLVEAFGGLTRTLHRLPLRMVIAGDGELFGEVRARVERAGLGGRVSLLGWRTDTAEVLREMDVFVLPSLYEGFSYTILEAMAAGLPVVSTAVFGTRQSVGRIPGNVLVPAGDPLALARGMERMVTLAEPGSLRRALREIGAANRRYVRAAFVQDETTRRTIELYRELAGRSVEPVKELVGES